MQKIAPEQSGLAFWIARRKTKPPAARTPPHRAGQRLRRGNDLNFEINRNPTRPFDDEVFLLRDQTGSRTELVWRAPCFLRIAMHSDKNLVRSRTSPMVATPQRADEPGGLREGRPVAAWRQKRTPAEWLRAGRIALPARHVITQQMAES